MIGLGAMGSALAQAFLSAGHKTTVWNRTSSKMKPLVAQGATGAASISGAIEASPIIVICVDNYEVTKSLVLDNNLDHSLQDRTLIQLSTGSPKDAIEFEEFIREFGCEYIDGAIMPYPDGIGDDDAKLLFAGPEKVYDLCIPYLRCLGGDLRYIGPNIKGAAALDMALLTHELCSHLGVIHGSLICESENINVGEYAAMFPEGSVDRIPIDIVHAESYDEPGATIAVWNAALEGIQNHAKNSKINSEVPDFISSLFKRAISAGYGEEDFAAIIKIMRASNVA
jgi:3-hydroxyisobutyrate dehydrogenase-like beta-hydroxyacid dehydrogenase